MEDHQKFFVVTLIFNRPDHDSGEEKEVSEKYLVEAPDRDSAIIRLGQFIGGEYTEYQKMANNEFEYGEVLFKCRWGSLSNGNYSIDAKESDFSMVLTSGHQLPGYGMKR